METTQSPIIRLQKESKRARQLRLKFTEYRRRLKAYGHANPFQAPELRLRITWDLFCRAYALARLLRRGEVNTHQLSWELVSKFPHSFDPNAFDTALTIINDYVTTGGAKCIGGTGLPEIPSFTG